MKQTLPFGKALLIALIFIVIYILVIFSTPELNSYSGLFLFACSPAVFIGVIIWCYILLILENANLLAPHFIFRFLVPFLVFSLLIWIISNMTDDPIIPAFQEYSFKEYIGFFLAYMKSAITILGSTFFALAGLFTLFVKKQKQLDLS